MNVGGILDIIALRTMKRAAVALMTSLADLLATINEYRYAPQVAILSAQPIAPNQQKEELSKGRKRTSQRRASLTTAENYEVKTVHTAPAR